MLCNTTQKCKPPVQIRAREERLDKESTEQGLSASYRWRGRVGLLCVLWKGRLAKLHNCNRRRNHHCWRCNERFRNRGLSRTANRAAGRRFVRSDFVAVLLRLHLRHHWTIRRAVHRIYGGSGMWGTKRKRKRRHKERHQHQACRNEFVPTPHN